MLQTLLKHEKASFRKHRYLFHFQSMYLNIVKLVFSYSPFAIIRLKLKFPLFGLHSYTCILTHNVYNLESR